ncbi:MAG: LysR family transcriptional regulator [Dehalococcoidia bacterium]|nr:LysR family transcriptional regulator [Dehalococcoidia bacterium]
MRHGLLPQLAVFEAVARLGSFTRAVEELHLAQPTVSLQVKKLAEAVGSPLFEQVGKRVDLTESGRVLYEASHEIFGALQKLKDTLAAARGLESRRFQLAVSTTGKYFAPRLLAEFANRYPGIEISLQIHNREPLVERLTQNPDDFYIFAHPPTETQVLSQRLLANPMVVFARADHPLAGESHIPFERFAREPFLMREPGSGTRLVAQKVFEEHGFAPRIRMELSTNEAVKQAILAGLGVSILSRYTPGLDVRQEHLVTLDVEGFPVEGHWDLVNPVGKQLSTVAQAFMDFAHKHAKALIFDHLAG